MKADVCPTCRGTGKVRVQNQSTGEWETDGCVDCMFIPNGLNLTPEQLGEPCDIIFVCSLQPGKATSIAAHKCVWFHSADAQHNISCCGMHEMFVDGRWQRFKAEDCPRCMT